MLKDSNNSKSINAPVKRKYDDTTKKWSLIDKHNFIIAEDLTEEHVDAIEHSLNLIGESITLLKMLMEQEDIVEYPKEVADKQVFMREFTVKKVNEFLTEKVGFKEQPQDFSQNLYEWGRNLLKLSKEENVYYKKML